MRFDSMGMFWEDTPVRLRAGAAGPREVGPPPEIPYTGWTPPTEFPNLSQAKVIGFDTETKDPELRTSGPGWGRDKGHIIGISVAVPGKAWYFPMRHEIQPEYNMDPDQVLRWAAHILGDDRPKVGANLVYDVGWLLQEGVTVNGPLWDVQYAEALLNSETPSVSLEALSNKYVGTGKVTSILYDWLASWLGGKANERQRANLYRSPPTLAGPYAEADAFLPIDILTKQWGLMASRGVLDLFMLECRLIPLLVKMRMKGTPVDVGKAEHIYETLGAEALEVEKRLKDLVGQPVNPAASASCKAAFARLSIPAPMVADKKTGANKPSFAAPLLEAIDHPLAKLIVEHRQLLKVKNTFIKSYILDKHVNGRIYCSFHPLKSDDSGARSGRFSSSDPNLQNIPVRTDMGRLVREAFVATGRWRKWDYSQIEYRLLAHHAVGQGSDELRAIFKNDPDADYHDVTISLIKKLTGIDLDRRPAKTINFGLIYGMSQAELAKRLKLDKAAANDLFSNYHRAAPFAKETMKAAADEVHQYGCITTLLGRKSDFPLWGPTDEYGVAALPQHEALMKWGSNIQRAYTHKALNRKLQGGAADIMKKAMVDAYEAGLFSEDRCGIPMLTVHDELDFDDQGPENAPCWKELREVMENCVETRVPIRVDDSVGTSWGNAD